MNKVRYMVYGDSPPENPILIRKKEGKIEAWSPLRPVWKQNPYWDRAFWGFSPDFDHISEREAKAIVEKYTKP